MDTVSSLAISPSTLGLVVGRRSTAARDTGGIAGAVRREAASRESEERGDGDDDRIRRSSDRATA